MVRYVGVRLKVEIAIPPAMEKECRGRCRCTCKHNDAEVVFAE